MRLVTVSSVPSVLTVLLILSTVGHRCVGFTAIFDFLIVFTFGFGRTAARVVVPEIRDLFFTDRVSWR